MLVPGLVLNEQGIQASPWTAPAQTADCRLQTTMMP